MSAPSARRVALATLAALSLPAAASACGGFFCDAVTPVVQAGERILFAPDGQHTEMHVQITYNGPPTEFGWLLPAPPDVEVGLSSDTVFTRLDAATQPLFTLRDEFADCFGAGGQGGGGGFGGEGEGEGEGEPGVDVLERQALGPFDQVILRADTVDALVEWLEENDFQRPAGAEEILADYVGTSVFVALKLLADAEVRDITPIRFRYTAPTLAIPLRPTAVAASADMGILVYVLGAHRAVPTNYLHVHVNEALLRWQQLGDNYPDLVSAAVDEAGGRAFVTDMAGPHRDIWTPLALRADLEDIAAARTFADLGLASIELSQPPIRSILRDAITPPDGIGAEEILRCPRCFELQNIAVDGETLARRIAEEVLPTWQAINDLFERNPHLTRLYTTMSPAEMTVDPMFGYNPDLGDVDRIRVATRYNGCQGDSTIETASGARYDASRGNADAVFRIDGETARGGSPAALRVERMMAAGAPEPVTDNSRPILAAFDAPLPDAFLPVAESDGCECDAGAGGASALIWLLVLAPLGLRRRRL